MLAIAAVLIDSFSTLTPSISTLIFCSTSLILPNYVLPNLSGISQIKPLILFFLPMPLLCFIQRLTLVRFVVNPTGVLLISFKPRVKSGLNLVV